jgi:hypothetical protein
MQHSGARSCVSTNTVKHTRTSRARLHETYLGSIDLDQSCKVLDAEYEKGFREYSPPFQACGGVMGGERCLSGGIGPNCLPRMSSG